MRSGIVLSTTLLALVVGTAMLANAEHGRDDHGPDSHGHNGNVHQQDHGRPARPEHFQHQENEADHRHDYRPVPQHAVQRGPEHEVHGGYAPQHMHEVRRSEPSPRYVRQDIWARQRAHDWQHEHRMWHERGGYHGYVIPEDRFRAHFGRGHWFRVHEVPVVVVEGSPRFQFGGFWFSVVDPCPETWSPVWYRTDDVYIDYVNDGYYMYNRRHPGVAISVNVSL